MYWWYRAAEAVACGRTLRAGLITTSSITQTQNRAVIAAAAERGARVTWAVADHVWYDGSDGAEVRVAMTVIANDPLDARLVPVRRVGRVRGEVPVTGELRVPRLNADLTAHADVAGASAEPLRANAGLASTGFKLHGAGFLLEPAETERLLAADPRLADVVRPYRNGKDLTAQPRGLSVIDFASRTEAEARAYAVAFDLVRDRVKPERDANPEPTRRQFWWRFGRSNEQLRSGLAGLARYVATPEMSKHRIFTFLDGAVAPDNAVVVIAVDDAFVLGVLSSAAHVVWALAAGGRMGVRDTPRYNKGVCFDTFPLPDPPAPLRREVADAAERIEAHRARALAASPDATLMRLYDVIEALRAGRPLTAAQQALHTAGACGVMRDLHDELDQLVAAAYGWTWPEPPALVLERLVALHDARREEERRGIVRWLRPDFQAPRFGGTWAGEADELGLTVGRGVLPSRPAWPGTVIEQIAALKTLADATPVSAEAATNHFAGARRDLVVRHLDTLAIMGELRQLSDGAYSGITVAV